jgi:hypothetical protein
MEPFQQTPWNGVAAAIPARMASVSALNCSLWFHGSMAAAHASKDANRQRAVPAANSLEIFGMDIGELISD